MSVQDPGTIGPFSLFSLRQTSFFFFHGTENVMPDALGHYTSISWLQPPSQRFPHLSPFWVQKFPGRVSLALLDQVTSSGPINFSKEQGYIYLQNQCWSHPCVAVRPADPRDGDAASNSQVPATEEGKPCSLHRPWGLEGREKEGAQGLCAAQHIFLSAPPLEGCVA